MNKINYVYRKQKVKIKTKYKTKVKNTALKLGQLAILFTQTTPS